MPGSPVASKPWSGRRPATVQIPLPVLGAFASIERSYFELCIRAGQQVLDAMMEQDRTALCGPALETRPRSPGGPRGHDAERGHAGWASDSADAPSRPQSVGAGGRAAQLRVRLAPRPAGCACGERGGLRHLHAEVCSEPRHPAGGGRGAVDVEERGLASLRRHDGRRS